jgi:leucyl aminopeptidase
MVEGALLGLYQFTHHKAPDQDKQPIKKLRIWAPRQIDVPDIEQGISDGRVLSEAISLCRDLVNEPSNYMTPTQLAIVATEIAHEQSLEISVLDKAQLEELGMGAILGVARGSHEPPKFIILRYWGDRENPDNNIALIGKGITFDSGGISIKPAAGMGAMKGDMAGAAAVLAAMKAISHLELRLNVNVLAACTENLPGGRAQKPGDVIRAMNGKTIEVENTDAEGRLVLADALSYARNIGMTRLVDVATLTGAIRTTLGTAGTGVFGTSQELVDRIVKASHHTGEKMWQLPLWEEFKEQNASQVADIKNTGGAAAGSATAAWFLAEFAEDTPWVHLDIAGTATSEATKGERVKGATGTQVRTLVALIQDLASS